MNLKTLNELSLLNTALSVEYSNYLTSAAKSSVTKKVLQVSLNIYAAYCYLIEQGNYTAFEILNDSNQLNAHFQSFIGFIYDCDGITTKRKYNLCCELRNLFRHIAQDKQLTLDEVQLSMVKITEGASNCLAQFRQLKIDKTKANYLNGWQVVSKEGKSFEVHLDTLYVNFGEAFTNKVHLALNNYAHTQKSTSLTHALKILKKLFIGMSTVYNKRDGLTIEALLSRNHVQYFFHKVFKVLFVRSQAALHCPKTFHVHWRDIINYYTACFIDTGVFAKPHKPFIVPNWKDPKGAAPTFSIGGGATERESNRWFADIPLKIKDEEAVSIIQQRVERDMAHIRHVCLVKFQELLEREERNKAFLKSGLVKPLSSNKGNLQYRNFIGADKLDNTVATFYAHGIAVKGHNYLHFLGFHGNASQLHTELNLPSKSTLSALLTLLVMEHPKITPFWLQRWELFDANGNVVGYKQVGNQYIAVSYKSRKGSTNAQQEVVLNEFSKSIVELLIQHTQIAREYLKKNGNINWRKMILTATVSSVVCPSILNSTLLSATDFYDWLQDISLFDKSSDITLEDAQAISDIHSLRSIRRHRGLQIYLETRSMDAVAEALGHEKKDANLLTSYLPKPLMDFFNDRWVRQFQNAILLEAMKDSVYRLDAVNMSAEDIEEFLSNHGISNIPEHFDHGFNQQTETDNETPESIAFNQLTYTISTSLLQLLMAIRLIIESEAVVDGCTFLEVVSHWYQSAVFVLDSLTSGKHDGDKELMEMLEIATNNKLDTDLIKGALLC
ncbi:hypothetical protein P7M03_19975 [Vibrio parahaemolyticus]|uniref:hypothetical protein n=1 Tax=Vibrio alginolyticus TaxID=663 RepID=UPI0023EBDA13|nr:hypothetical protein [Vibrio alginolyticus]MDF4345073.1 hypothetical protein [Vibrio parahaemolyticus]MDF4357351.1 hypothetical protein [Vibrio parahaemolyticus]MDF4418874.1 hypothetical protein [Vibrio parahaemolyticus]MDF4771094.1 hypothetical protein [Vibrio parahaemolyticus]MDF4776300.1 hypothetical protein [Vibrio parahaemolyticus]